MKYLERVEVDNDILTLATKYIEEKVVGQTSFDDCIHIATATIHSRVIAEVKSPSHFDLPYQFDLIGINLSALVKSYEGRIVLLHNTSSLLCSSEIAEFSQRKFKNLEIKTIESEGHPVEWSPQITEWVYSNLVFHKIVTH